MNDWYQPGYEDQAGFLFMMLIICGVGIIIAACAELREHARRVYRQRHRARRGGHHR